MRASLFRLVLLLAPLLISTADLLAQDPQPARDSLDAPRSGWLVGVSVGVPGYEAQAIPQLFTVGVHWTRVHANRVGADFSVGTMPRVLTDGFFVIGARGGIALPLALSPGVLLLPSTGISLIGAGDGGGGGGSAGVNAGISAVLLQTQGIGLRTGITAHRFADMRGAVWLWEFGVVRMPQ